jgi:hypothetical protein
MSQKIPFLPRLFVNGFCFYLFHPFAMARVKLIPLFAISFASWQQKAKGYRRKCLFGIHRTPIKIKVR